MKYTIISALQYLRHKQKYLMKPRRVLLVADSISKEQLEEILRRLAFYCPGAVLVPASPLIAYFSRSPVLVFGRHALIHPFIDIIRFGIFHIDYRTNPFDGWDWASLAGLSATDPDLVLARKRFTDRVEQLQKRPFTKCYLFGTGPSLRNAGDHDWSDGYRIVCNTIVRNRELWHHINPHFIVAGDAIYHFGHTDHAIRFRKDLKERLMESETCFLYPHRFDAIVKREMSVCSDRLIPVPIGFHKKIQHDLRVHFSLPRFSNVLTLLLLPLGCTLSQRICLWGFDGRAPDDTLFWGNSTKESYPELLDTVKNAHPAFFDHLIPHDDPFRYVRDVHGDILDSCLKDAEGEGFRFVMMHDSWTPVLQQRRKNPET